MVSVCSRVMSTTNLIYFIPTALSAIIVNYRDKNIDTKLARNVSICGIIGAVVGAMISVKMDVQNLRKYFGIFLAVIAIHEIYTLFREYKIHRKRNTKSS